MFLKIIPGSLFKKFVKSPSSRCSSRFFVMNPENPSKSSICVAERFPSLSGFIRFPNVENDSKSGERLPNVEKASNSAERFPNVEKDSRSAAERFPNLSGLMGPRFPNVEKDSKSPGERFPNVEKDSKSGERLPNVENDSKSGERLPRYK